MQHILPPRLGGPIALLEEATDADVVFCGHAGFDGYAHISDIWSGRLVGQTIHIRFWRHPAAEVPRDEEGLVAWLYERWQMLDDWVGEQRRIEARGGRRQLSGFSRPRRRGAWVPPPARCPRAAPAGARG